MDIARSNGPLVVPFTVTVAVTVGEGGGDGVIMLLPPQPVNAKIKESAAPNASVFIAAYSTQTSVRWSTDAIHFGGAIVPRLQSTNPSSPATAARTPIIASNFVPESSTRFRDKKENPIAGRKPSLGIPGSRDTVELETTGTNTTQLRLAVSNLTNAENELRRAGFAPKKRPGVLAVADPGGNGIVFERK